MIEIIKELNIEVSKPNVFQAVVAKQYDMNTRFIKATFVDGGGKISIDPTSTVKVVINALRPDGESKGFDGTVNEDGTVTVPLHSWMLELVGTVICDISVIDTETDDNKKLTTTSFTLIVEKAAYGGNDITSDPQYDVLVTLVETCTEASEAAKEALTKSNEALEKSNEANSKYDACVEATENANAVREEIEAGGYIESLKEMNNGGKFSFWVGTQEQYDKINPKTQNCFYIITDDTTGDDIRAAIENINEEIAEVKTDFIVEQGESGNWRYEKWNSGKAKCWRNFTYDLTKLYVDSDHVGYGIVEGGGNDYDNNGIPFPTGLFTSVPTVNYSVANGKGENGANVTNAIFHPVRDIQTKTHTGCLYVHASPFYISETWAENTKDTLWVFKNDGRVPINVSISAIGSWK
jgi:hypothetical protein